MRRIPRSGKFYVAPHITGRGHKPTKNTSASAHRTFLHRRARGPAPGMLGQVTGLAGSDGERRTPELHIGAENSFLVR